MAEDTFEDIEVARDLARMGVPIFLAKRADTFPDGGHRGSGYWLPKRWEQTEADPTVLDDWRPGMAVCAVGGHGVDFLDIDTQKGGAESLDSLNGTRPKAYGKQRTPSGGQHDLIASVGARSRDGFLPGLDLKAGVGKDGLGFVFLAPTEKRSKVTGKVGRYTWGQRPDIDGLLVGDESGRGLAAMLHREAPERTEYDGPDYEDLPAERRRMADDYVAGFIETWKHRLKRALDLPDEYGAVDDHGLGWEGNAKNCAFEFMRVALAPWNDWDVDDARQMYHEILPDEIAANEDCKGKWDEGRVARAAEQPTWEAPWVTRTPATEEFEPVESEGGPVVAGAWEPVDLATVVAGVLDGTITRPEPTIGDFGGGCLFYPGRINSVHGDSTGGKTWTALVTAKQELAKGEAVVYVDLEDTAAGVVSRLLHDLHVPADAVSERFVYLHPDEPLSPAAARGLAALLDARRPSLVVVDSTGEALAIEGANPNADEEVAKWFRLLPRLAVRCGAAVLLLDHATKSGDNDLWPIGSQRKRAAVTGAAYLQKVVAPFGKGHDGKAVLKCAKDRHGNYPLGWRVAALQVRDGLIDLADETGSAAADFRPTGLMERVSLVLEAAAAPMSGRAVTDAVTGKKGAVAVALAGLVREGHVQREAGPRGSHLHTSVRPYREADDDGGTVL